MEKSEMEFLNNDYFNLFLFIFGIFILNGILELKYKSLNMNLSIGLILLYKKPKFLSQYEDFHQN